MRKILPFLPAALFYGLIFFLSSRRLNLNVSLPHFDKLAHGAAYGVLGFLLALGVFRGLSASLRTKTICILLTGATLGILDEVHQIFVPGRSADPLDAAMDVLGVVFGLVLYRWVART